MILTVLLILEFLWYDLIQQMQEVNSHVSILLYFLLKSDINILDGFRKIKSELYSHNLNWWEFKHPHFRRGQPELLSEIKRAVHYGKFMLFYNIVISSILFFCCNN
jgi:hypothetical protein